MRWLTRRARGGDSGAAAVFIAIIVVIVVVPLAAIVADAGAIFSERRQQQNGADGAVLGVIQTCVKTACDTGTGATSTAGSLANLNANDAKTQVDRVCGTYTGLTGCPAATGARWDCPAASGSAKYAQVYTSVQTTDNKHVLPAWFGRAIFGPTFAGAAVKACARAAVGTPAGASVFPLAISECEWDQDVGWNPTTQTATYAPSPPYPPYPSATLEKTLLFHNPSNIKKDTTLCKTQTSGQDLPGGFGWLKTTGGCVVVTTTGETLPADPGRSGCDTAFPSLQANQTIVYVPIYDSVTASGNNATYHIAGYGAFVVTGYSFNGGAKSPSYIPGTKTSCAAKDDCVYGFFLKALVSGPISSTPGFNFGATAIGLTG